MNKMRQLLHELQRLPNNRLKDVLCLMYEAIEWIMKTLEDELEE